MLPNSDLIFALLKTLGRFLVAFRIESMVLNMVHLP